MSTIDGMAGADGRELGDLQAWTDGILRDLSGGVAWAVENELVIRALYDQAAAYVAESDLPHPRALALERVLACLLHAVACTKAGDADGALAVLERGRYWLDCC